jgi:alkylglycerol monooxygenase
MNPIVYAIPVFLATILIEAWLAHRRRLPVYDTADALTSLHFGVLSQVAVAFTFIFSFGYYSLIYENLRLFSLPRDSIWVWLFAVLAYDFCYYWVHRCGHEVNLLWAAHQVCTIRRSTTT